MIEKSFTQEYNPDFSNVTVIERKDAPRKIIKNHTEKRVHKSKPIITYDSDMKRYFCIDCGVPLKASKVEAHKKL